MWFRKFCKEIRIYTENRPIIVHEENQGCINTANGDCNTNSRRMKNVDIQLNFIREVINDSIIKLKYTPTMSMLANFLTKSICRPALSSPTQYLESCIAHTPLSTIVVYRLSSTYQKHTQHYV
ncbi:hypothetical protein O181_075453, partial [Austropuccinia psidii MF-1]|nr:hypothetical protein [Austropuccinia psidii MF-1]